MFQYVGFVALDAATLRRRAHFLATRRHSVVVLAGTLPQRSDHQSLCLLARGAANQCRRTRLARGGAIAATATAAARRPSVVVLAGA